MVIKICLLAISVYSVCSPLGSNCSDAFCSQSSIVDKARIVNSYYKIENEVFLGFFACNELDFSSTFSFHNGAPSFGCKLDLALLLPVRSCFHLQLLCWVMFFQSLCKSRSSWDAFDSFSGFYISTELQLLTWGHSCSWEPHLEAWSAHLCITSAQGRCGRFFWASLAFAVCVKLQRSNTRGQRRHFKMTKSFGFVQKRDLKKKKKV